MALHASFQWGVREKDSLCHAGEHGRRFPL